MNLRPPRAPQVGFPLRLSAVAIILVSSVLLAPAIARGHDFTLTEARLEISADGTMALDIICDLDALALGVASSTDDAELVAALVALSSDERMTRRTTLERMLTRRLRLRADGERLETTVFLPEAPRDPASATPAIPEALPDSDERPTFLGVTARLEAVLPDDAESISFSASRAFPPVHLTIVDRRTGRTERQVLEQAVPSVPYRLDAPPSLGGRLRVAWRYLALGFRHIVPAGPDHVLFVLGLFLLTTAWRPLLWQVSAFTLAHTVTLACAALGFIALPAHIVEPLIALSIAYVAIENVVTDRLSAWRPALVFAFGLLHGLGFAGVLGDLGLPRPALAGALIGFNVGVELGQLAVIAAAFVVLGPLRNRPWYRRRVTVPLSLVIAAIGLYWFVERALGG